MGMQVVEAACQFTADRSKGVVTIESDCTGPPFQAAFTELSEGRDSRDLATSFASTVGGMGVAHINGNVIGPYPVNKEGLSLENVRGENGTPLPANHPRMQPDRYRIDIPVARPLR